MRKYLGIILVGAMVAFGAGCSDDDEAAGGSGGSAGNGGSAGTGGGAGDGGSGGSPAAACAASEGVDLCAENGGSGQITFDEEIDGDTCLSTDCTYLIDSLTYVVNGTLTVKPGVTVLGEGTGSENAALIVTQSARIEAVGTADEPIVFTSNLPEGSRTSGDWGGLVMLGRARINSGTSISGGSGECNGAEGDCEDTIEGLDPAENRGNYGGDDDNHDCGTLQYVRVEFGGFQLTPDNETNSVTLGGCGDQTTISYVQAHRGLDDAFEMFGGKPNMDHLIASGMDDDGLDWDQGFTGTIQYAVVDHFAGGSEDPRGFETDNLGSNFDAQPRSAPTVQYVTAIGYTGGDRDTQQGVLNREGTRGQLSDMIVTGFNGPGYDMRDNGWVGAWPTDFFVENTCFFGNNPDFPDDDNDPDNADSPTEFFDEPDELTLAELGNRVEDPEFSADAFIGENGDQPDYTPGNPNCIGAFGPEGEDWVNEGAPWSAYPVE